MDTETLMSLSEKILSRPVMIGIIWVLSLMLFGYWLYVRYSTKKLLQRCNDLQANDVKLTNENNELKKQLSELMQPADLSE